MNLKRDYCNAEKAATRRPHNRVGLRVAAFSACAGTYVKVLMAMAAVVMALPAFGSASRDGQAAFSGLSGSGIPVSKVATAQQRDSASSEISSANQGFAINKDKIANPEGELRGFAEMLDSTFRDGNLLNVKVTGTASPDGPYLNNKRLAEGRAAAVSGYLQDSANVPADYFTINVIPEDWDRMMEILPEYVSESEVAQVEYIIATYEDLDRRERFLRSVNGGRTWRKIVNTVLPRLRNVYLEAEVRKPAGEECILEETPSEIMESMSSVEQDAEVPGIETQKADAMASSGEEPSFALQPRHWYIKTNLPAWAMLIANIQAEMDIVDHLSVMLPIYYSGWDYFKRTLKYRTFTVLPEVRGWVRGDNQGLFFGLHGGFSYYNVALDGGKRYQDRDGRTPAWGGGVTVGYRLPIRSASPWQFEFSAGFGIYHLDYDIFNNVHNGLKIGSRKKTFYGLDNFAITLSYRFPQKRMRLQKSLRYSAEKGGGL